jgi:4-carboxymuconolactone decarboxylase
LAITVLSEGGALDMVNIEERYKRGYDQLKALDATAADNVIKGLQDIAPEMADFIIEFAYGDVASRPDLDLRYREIATVAALTALGNAIP